MIKQKSVERGSHTIELQRSYRKRFFASNKKPATLDAVTVTIPVDKSIIDIGGGFGQHVRFLRKLGYDAYGIDGTEGIDVLTDGDVRHFDLSLPGVGGYRNSADWGLFIEVGEHIPAKYEDIVFDNVSAMPREGLIVSWAPQEARGVDHVNCHEIEYVIERFWERGWLLDDYATKKARRFSLKKYQHLFVLRKAK